MRASRSAANQLSAKTFFMRLCNATSVRLQVRKSLVADVAWAMDSPPIDYDGMLILSSAALLPSLGHLAAKL